jgi:hypothetical protein
MSTIAATGRARSLRIPLAFAGAVALGAGLYLALGPFWDWAVYDLASLPHGTHYADAIHFFFFDTTKILLLLVGIIFVVRILRSFLSIERTRALLGGKREGVRNVLAVGPHADEEASRRHRRG